MKKLTYCRNGDWGLTDVCLWMLSNKVQAVIAKLKDYEDAEEKTNSCEGCIHYHGGEYDPICEECHRAYEDDYYETEEAEVKEAHWITKGHEMGFCHCSECLTVSDWQHNYCPNCGAKMEE